MKFDNLAIRERIVNVWYMNCRYVVNVEWWCIFQDEEEGEGDKEDTSNTGFATVTFESEPGMEVYGEVGYTFFCYQWSSQFKFSRTEFQKHCLYWR
jgi:hypothetical protein